MFFSHFQKSYKSSQIRENRYYTYYDIEISYLSAKHKIIYRYICFVIYVCKADYRIISAEFWNTHSGNRVRRHKAVYKKAERVPLWFHFFWHKREWLNRREAQSVYNVLKYALSRDLGTSHRAQYYSTKRVLYGIMRRYLPRRRYTLEWRWAIIVPAAPFRTPVSLSIRCTFASQWTSFDEPTPSCVDSKSRCRWRTTKISDYWSSETRIKAYLKKKKKIHEDWVLIIYIAKRKHAGKGNVSVERPQFWERAAAVNAYL